MPGWVRAGSLLAGAAILIAGLIPARQVVELSVGGERIDSFAAETPFTLSYIHSIDSLPIEEDLVARDGELLVERTRLKQFGAGMGYIDGMGNGRAEGDWWVVDDLNRPIGDALVIRAGAPHIDHRLRLPERQWLLSACWPGEAILVETRTVSMIQHMWASIHTSQSARTRGCVLEENS